MPIMSDKWIKFKAEKDQLIVPFHPESRSVNEDGTPVTSYGLSSFGYDIRLGNIFRLFNHRNSNNLNVDIRSVREAVSPDVIDPVNFNEALTSRHELRDGECITIPPHGFMLGVSKERIKLGRDFTAICMEKSTLARCFTGDTKIALVDGTTPTFLEAIERVKNGEKLFGYSIDNDGCVAVSELIEPRKIGTEEVLVVVLDNGEEIECTPDHAFMKSDGTYIEAQDMEAGTSIMPLYKDDNRGVVEIRRDKKIKDVYCLTAPEFGNFALEAGVFVKNCGLGVTVTPLESGWEGYVTLELSNKTDLPIKLTPGMGICQVLFIHGNEPCEISYADRNGKYQDQPPEPVLPRRKM